MVWLRNCWYVAAWADELAQGARLARTIIDEPILFWRDAKGHVVALADRCAHRLVPLSLGKIDGDIVRCGYHGLSYEGSSGRCIHNPHGPVIRSLAVKMYAVTERHKIIWVWMGDAEAADPEAIPDLSFADEAPNNAFSKGYMPTAADHRLLEDNILDLTHGDYLHAETLGGGSFTRADVTVEERGNTVFIQWAAENETAIPIWQTELPDPSMPVNMITEVLWHPSGVMLLDSRMAPIDIALEEGLITRNAHIMTPETATSTHYFYCNSRNYKMDDAAYNAAMTAGLAVAFGCEDKPMIEAQQLRIGTADLLDCQPALLAIDNASTRARRIFKRLIETEKAAIST